MSNINNVLYKNAGGAGYAKCTSTITYDKPGDAEKFFKFLDDFGKKFNPEGKCYCRGICDHTSKDSKEDDNIKYSLKT